MAEVHIPNNPAARFLRIVQRALANKAVRDLRVDRALQELLNSEGCDRPTLMYRIGVFFDMPSAIGRAIQASDLDPGIYLAWLAPVEKQYADVHLPSRLNEYLAPIDEKTIALLRVCEDQLSKRSSERLINESDVRELQVEVEKLREAIVKSELPDQVRQYCLTHLQLIADSLVDVFLKGPDVFVSTLKSVLGHSLLHKTELDKVSESPFKDRFWGITVKYNTLISAVYNTLQLSGPLLGLAGRLLTAG